MHSVIPKPLKTVFLWSLLLILAACSTTETPLSLDESNSPYYIASVEISDATTEAQLEAEYNAEIVSFVPEAGFAVLGFSKEAGELTTLITSINQDTFASPVITMGGHSAWAGGFSAWAGGWRAWAGGFSAWAGGFSAWAGNDPDSSMQANANAWDQIKLKEAHAISRKFGEGIKVAVIDSGIDLSHPIFEGRLSYWGDWWDYVDNDWYPQEASSGLGKGHGTAVTSIILQIAPNAKIMPLRVLDADGKGDTDMVVKAIQRAIDKGADIINISLGSEMDDNALSQMAAYANSKNIMIFASSGNYSGEGTMTYPGNYSWASGTYRKTLGIGSVNADNKLSDFTSYGNALYGVAPGNGILAAYPGNQSVNVKGTSFAAPMFTGAAALALSEMPGSMDRDRLPDFFWGSMDWSVVDLNPGVGGARLLNVEALLRKIDGFTEPQYRIKNVTSGKCLEVYGGSTNNGGNVDQWWCYNSSWNQWKLIPEGDFYRIINVNSGKALDVAGGSSSDGANVHQWNYLGGNNQKWKLVNSNNGSFELKAVHSNKCLDVSKASTADGANVQQWSCNGTGAQKWTLQLAN